MLRVEPRVVAADHPVALQPAHALGAGRGRQPDPLAQLGEGDPALQLEDAQDVAVDAVQMARTVAAWARAAGGHGKLRGSRLWQEITPPLALKSRENRGNPAVVCAHSMAGRLRPVKAPDGGRHAAGPCSWQWR